MPQLDSSVRLGGRNGHPIRIAQGEKGAEAGGKTGTGERAEEHKAGELPDPGLMFSNSLVVVLLMLGLGVAMTRKFHAVPKGLSNFGEWLAESLRDFTVGIIGPEGEKHTPLVGTVFLYIMTMNLIGLIPGFHSPTSNITITLALGVSVFLYAQYWGIRNNGLGGYLRHFLGPSLNKSGFPHIFFLLGPIEVFSELIKPFTLAIRLFGNIFGEDVILVVLAGLGATFGASFLPLHFVILPLMLITDLVQALVFSILTCIYLSLLSPHGHSDEHGGHDFHADENAADHGAAEALTV